MTLDQLPLGENATIQSVEGKERFRRQMERMGLTAGQQVTATRRAPLGDTLLLCVHSCSLAISREAASQIVLGEGRKTNLPPERLAAETKAVPLPVGASLHFALVGNQNCGKSTLFNRITGGRQRVGNFPGVTVERKEGRLRYMESSTVTDLPGVYSLEPYSPEERITRQCLTEEKTNCIINVVDATNLERSLRLTMKILELGIPTVIALNMMDEVRANGGTIDGEKLSRELGVPVVPISAARGKGVPTLLNQAILTARGGQPPKVILRGNDRQLADYRKALCESCVSLPRQTKQYRRSALADGLLAGRFTGLPCLGGILALIFWLAFQKIGPFFSNQLEGALQDFTGLLAILLERWEIVPVLQGLLLDGVCRGIGSVLGFLPIILTLFFFLSLLEDSGYMARVAYLLDGPFRKLGLSGRSAVPLLMGFGCSVPAVMACRTLPDRKSQKATIVLIPFMSCSAKLPIYALLAAAFFPKQNGGILIGLYLLGILCGVVGAWITRGSRAQEPFLLELPNYRLPGLKNTLALMGQKARDFLHKAFTIIFMASLLLWLLQGFDWRLTAVSDPRNSILAGIAGWLTPAFRPLGLGDWRIVTALLTGLLAKESVVSTLAVLFGDTGTLQNTISQTGTAALLVFCLLYTPCAAAMAAVRQELGRTAALKMMVAQSALAWSTAYLVQLLFSAW